MNEEYDIPHDEAPSEAPAVEVATAPSLPDAGESVTETFAAHESQKPYFRGRLAGVVNVDDREEFLSEFCDTGEKRVQLAVALAGLGIGKTEGGI